MIWTPVVQCDSKTLACPPADIIELQDMRGHSRNASRCSSLMRAESDFLFLIKSDEFPIAYHMIL
jgi:hypothetical protein